jgi:glucose/arabinose dehydrogenase
VKSGPPHPTWRRRGGVLLVLLAAATAAAAPSPASALPPARALEVPAPYVAELYATGLNRPTALAFGPDRLLYATQESGEVVAVGHGTTRPRVVARGFRTPLGLAWSGRRLFVSAQGSLHRLVVNGRRVSSRRTILSGLPFGRHQQNTVLVGRDGRLYLGSGSTCDVCRERDPRSAAILSVRQDGSGLRVVARGLRNPFGLARDPRTGRVYASDNARDDLGSGEPAETIVRIRAGADYGWPRCWASWRQRRLLGSCAGVERPVAYLEPHSSADSLAFWEGKLHVALWGQYASEQRGRKLVRVDVRTGRNTTLAAGFEHPLGLAVAPAGNAILVGDWGRGVVYRIRRR